MKSILIDKVEYQVDLDEFKSYTHPQYNNLKLYFQLAEVERIVGLLLDIQSTFDCKIQLSSNTQISFGGYIQDQVQSYVDYPSQIYCSLENSPPSLELLNMFEYVLSPYPLFNFHKSFEWKITNTDSLYLGVRFDQLESFKNKYHWYIYEDVLKFDNLIHLVMIVKNAGSGFAEILEKNIPHIDRWTILDTGSTDDTIKIIQEILAPKVRGELYQEPFIDFGTSRNRVLELAGKACKFTLMLDDTYYIEGDLRGFLNEVRSDQFADSFSLYITSHDVQYTSNRVVKTKRNLKYIFKIHEVIQETDNINVIIPIDRAKIHDKQSDYMQTRTINRKTLDLQLLKQSVQEEPDNPRHIYYIAQTYVGMENWEMAYRYFLTRVYHHVDGFLQEKIDACFEAARTAQFRLNRPWNEVKPLYEKAYEMDPTRPDSVYFLGIKEYLDNNFKQAYELFKKAFNIGYPLHAQYSLKPTLSYHFTPKFLVNSLCWDYEDYELGEKAAKLYIQNNSPDPVIESWFLIYQQLTRLPKISRTIRFPPKPYLCFVADGNWNKWTGRDLVEKGLGGSETYIVEMSNCIQATGKYQVVVFCKCSVEETYNGVEYRDIEKYYNFITENVVQHCIVSRFSEYLPITYKSQVENVYLVVHDLTPTGTILIRHPKLKGIFTLTEWHNSYLEKIFSSLSDLMIPIHYGIRQENFRLDNLKYSDESPCFIYSSFPNRGLLPLLEMWKDIRKIFPKARLDIYSRIDHPWCLQHFPEQMKQISNLILQEGIYSHGWVDSHTLADAWKKADIWLYPCIFQETFCHTALQAAVSKTLAITSDLAALQNTVGDRGFMIIGDPLSSEWKRQALNLLKILSQNPDKIQDSINRNYNWALEHSWENQSKILLEHIQYYELEYRNKHNWTINFPISSRDLLIKILKGKLKLAICPRILEIGTYTGTSLIHLLQLLPNSSAIAIDSWDDIPELNIQESFMRNLKKYELQDRVEIFKSNPRDKLLDMLQENQDEFHLIMINNNDNTIDVFTDLVLTWKLLRSKGLMVIDNYNNFNDTVDQFLGQYAKQVKIVFKDHQMFLQKQ